MVRLTDQWKAALAGGEVPDQLLKFVTLLGLSPAIMTSLIAPRLWLKEFVLCAGSCQPARLMEPAIADVPVYTAVAIFALAVGLLLLATRRSLWPVLLLVPLLLFAVRGELDQSLNASLARWFGDGRYFAGEWLYNMSTSFVFLYFVFLPQRVIRTRYFAAFVAFLFFMMLYEPHFGLRELLFYLASVAVARVVYRFATENLAMFARLGVQRTAALLAKSLLLMVPIIALIGVGEIARRGVEAAVTDSVYSSRPLCGYREWLAAADTPYGSPNVVAAAYVDTIACPDLVRDTDRSFDPDDPIHQTRAKLELEAREKLPLLHRNLMADNRCAEFAFDVQRPRQHLERDLCYYAEYLHAGRAEAMKAALKIYERENAGTADEIRQQARAAVAEALPGVTIYRPRRCPEFPWLPCELKQAVLWVTDHAVNGAIDRTRETVVREADDVVAEAKAANADVSLALSNHVDEKTEQLRLATRSVLSNGFDLLGVLDYVLLLLMVLAFLKSLLFVFARVVFSSVDPDAVIDFTNHGETLPRGDIIVHGKRYTLTGDGRVYYARQAQVEGIAPSIALPHPLSCIFSRLASGVYFMNRANTADAPEGRVVFKTGDVRQFVEWRLAAGEQVVFHFKDFIAADDTVGFSTLISFRIPTLLMGRFLYRVASGPGRLILRTDGAAETIDQIDAKLSKPVYRVVAWHRAARFKLAAEQSFADIYLSSVHVKMTPGDLVVFMAEAGDRRRVGTGAARFVKNFILPV